MYYFDYAAATPMSDTVRTAMEPYFSDRFYNPSALYLQAQSVKQDIIRARGDVAVVLGCKPSEVIFTAGGTESDNLAVQGVMQAFPGANCVVSAIEHEAVLEPAKQNGAKLIPVKSDGRVDIAVLEKLIDDKTVLVSVMYANNEIGTVQPLREIAKLIQKIRTERTASPSTKNPRPLYLHTDACQAANYLPLLVNTLGVDLMTLNGGKIYGPKQSGMLFVRTGVKLRAQILGGGHERGYRSGTENVPAIIGFATALQEAQQLRESEVERLAALQAWFIKQLPERLPGAILNGSIKHRLPNNLHLTFPGADNERLLMELDERGIMVATGSACSASLEEPSHVLKAIGLSDSDARSSLRMTFGRQTSQSDLQHLLDNLPTLVA